MNHNEIELGIVDSNPSLESELYCVRRLNSDGVETESSMIQFWNTNRLSLSQTIEASFLPSERVIESQVKETFILSQG